MPVASWTNNLSAFSAEEQGSQDPPFALPVSHAWPFLPLTTTSAKRKRVLKKVSGISGGVVDVHHFRNTLMIKPAYASIYSVATKSTE